MSTPSDDAGHDRLGEFLDGNADAPRFAADERAAAAADLFVHGVLSHFATDDAVLDARIRTALATIDRPAHRGRTVKLVAAAAALVAVVAWLALGLERTPQLEAQARRIVTAANAERDLEYAFALTTARGVHLEGQLYVRGLDRFVAIAPTQAGELRIGYDGVDAWCAPAIEFLPVFVSELPDRIREQLWQLGAPLPFMSLARLLEGLDTEYDLRVGTDTRLAAARRTPRDRLRPTRLDIDADPATATVRAATIGWDDPTAPLDGVAIQLTLVTEAARPDAFYGHTAHHAVDRALRRIARPR